MQDLDPLAKDHYYLQSLRRNKEALQNHKPLRLDLLSWAMRNLLAADDEMPEEPFDKMIADTRRDIMQSPHVRSARLEDLTRKLGTTAKLPTVRACLKASECTTYAWGSAHFAEINAASGVVTDL